MISIGGALTACLGMVANGDELVIICHGVPGSFTWGGATYTDFGGGAGQMPVPPGFSGLMNVTVRLCICYSAAVPGGTDSSVSDKLEAAMGGLFHNHSISGFEGQVGVVPIFELCGGTEAQRLQVANDLRDNRAWRAHPPANRPGTGGKGQPANQQSAAQAQADALLETSGAVIVKIPNQVGAREDSQTPATPGYAPPQDGQNLAELGTQCNGCDCSEFEWVDGGDMSIPTLSQWGLIFMGIGLVGFGGLAARRFAL